MCLLAFHIVKSLKNKLVECGRSELLDKMISINYTNISMEIYDEVDFFAGLTGVVYFPSVLRANAPEPDKTKHFNSNCNK